MTIAQVLYVLEIADCRSISAAAERQFISQSALSQQIQRLEGELGYPLFVRTPRGLTLTAAGETFCREARPVAEQWQRLCSAVKPDGRRGRRLRIGMGARVYSNRLFQDIARYFDSHPEIDVTFVTEAGLDVLAGLRDGSIDLALDRLPAGEEGDPQDGGEKAIRAAGSGGGADPAGHPRLGGRTAAPGLSAVHGNGVSAEIRRLRQPGRGGIRF